MRYRIEEHPIEGITSLIFESGVVVDIKKSTGRWSITGWRKPTLEDLQAIVSIVLEVLTLPVGSEEGGE